MPRPLELGARQGTGYQETQKKAGIRLCRIFEATLESDAAGAMQQACSAVTEMTRLGPWVRGNVDQWSILYYIS